MRIYKSKVSLLAGSSYDEVLAAAKREYKKIDNHTKRQPYVRSAYFNGDKIFIYPFWQHIMQKNRKDRFKRLKLYRAALDLLRNNRNEPETITKKQDLSFLMHRFYGITKDGQEFCVQVKQRKSNGRKEFMSVFDKKLR